MSCRKPCRKLWLKQFHFDVQMCFQVIFWDLFELWRSEERKLLSLKDEVHEERRRWNFRTIAVSAWSQTLSFLQHFLTLTIFIWLLVKCQLLDWCHGQRTKQMSELQKLKDELQDLRSQRFWSFMSSSWLQNYNHRRREVEWVQKIQSPERWIVGIPKNCFCFDFFRRLNQPQNFRRW